jgi:hypothetical protein
MVMVVEALELCASAAVESIPLPLSLLERIY